MAEPLPDPVSPESFLSENREAIDNLFTSLAAAADLSFWPLLDALTPAAFDRFVFENTTARPGQSQRKGCNPNPRMPPLGPS